MLDILDVLHGDVNIQNNPAESFVLCFKELGAAENFDKKFRDLIETKNPIYIADIINLVGGRPNSVDRKCGWRNLTKDDIGTAYTSSGWMCELPAPYHLLYSKPSNTETYNSTVDHPQHYQSETGLEVIDVIDAFTDGLDGVEAFDTGNIIKYICRWKKKNGIEDLEKAKWYLENLIKNVKEKENEDVK